MSKPSQRLGCSLMFRNGLCSILVVPPWQRNLTLLWSLTVIRVAGSLYGVQLQVPLILGGRGWWMEFLMMMCYSLWLHHRHHHLNLYCRLVHFQNSWISWEAFLPVGLYLIWWRVIIFSLGVILHYPMISQFNI